MSITLKLQHEDGIRLRQQIAHTITRAAQLVDGKPVEGGPVISGKEWRFEKTQDSTGRTTEECQQDEDMRRVGPDGKKVKLGTYTLYITAGMKNLVVERKGKVAPFNFKNPAIRNQMKIQYQALKDTGRVTKEKKPVFEWVNDGPAQFIPPNTFGGIFVGDKQRAILEEMPT